jgi:hypothetical protein
MEGLGLGHAATGDGRRRTISEQTNDFRDVKAYRDIGINPYSYMERTALPRKLLKHVTWGSWRSARLVKERERGRERKIKMAL